MLEDVRWLKQSAFLWEKRGIYVDPLGVPSDAPMASAILITHSHPDHYSWDDIQKISSDKTVFVAPLDVADDLQGKVGTTFVVTPGDAFEVLGHSIDAVPAYNLNPERLSFHPAANRWVGYVFTIDGVRYYHAGDTDHIPEMAPISCDVAFLPIGGGFTMDAAEAAEAARDIGAAVAVPMHYGFFVGSAQDGKRFAELAPVEVEEMIPEVPFGLP